MQSRSTSLTKREQEILLLIAQQKNNQEISQLLFTSRETINTHRKNIQKKLAVRNTAGMMCQAIRQGILDVAYIF